MPDMVVRHELTLNRFLGERFLEISDDDLPDRVLEALRAQGIDPAAAGLDRDILGALRDTRTREPIGPVTQPVQPQAHRQACKARLNERSRVLAARICAATGLPPAGRKLAATGVGGATNDLAAVIILVNQAVNAFLGIPHAAAGNHPARNSNKPSANSTPSATPCRPRSPEGWRRNARPPSRRAAQPGRPTSLQGLRLQARLQAPHRPRRTPPDRQEPRASQRRERVLHHLRPADARPGPRRVGSAQPETGPRWRRATRKGGRPGDGQPRRPAESLSC